MRHEHDMSLNDANALVSQRIRGLPEFRNARDLVLESAERRVFDFDRGGPSVAVLRRLGGYTAIVEYAIAALPEHYRADKGSKMFPRSVVDELRFDAAALREALQRRIVNRISAR